jgi:periplasmic copper chaperone A
MATIIQQRQSQRAFGLVTECAWRTRFAVAVLIMLNNLAPVCAASGGVSITDEWLRFVIPTSPAAGYFRLDNNTDAAIELVGAASPACGDLMLHQSRNVNGTETMRLVKSVRIPARGSVNFIPGGYHLMCMSPTATLSPGKNVPVTLKFADGKSVTVDFPVRGVATE